MPPVEFFISALIRAVSGAVSATVFSLFWRPKALRNKTPFVAGSLTGAISAVMAVMLTGWVMNRLGMDQSNIDHVMAASCLTGILSLPVLGWVARYMEKREDRDIAEILRAPSEPVTKSVQAAPEAAGPDTADQEHAP